MGEDMTGFLLEAKGRGGIEAKLVAASVSPHGIPIYTFETKAPKFLDAEIEKHRMLSSNSSSSRAIPVNQHQEFFFPPDVRKEERGMQGHEEVSEEIYQFFKAGLDVILKRTKGLLWWHTKEAAEYKHTRGIVPIHKQHLNRYLEPFLFQKKVITGTEWANFFKLRRAKDADPNIQILANLMWELYNEAHLTELGVGEWHLPYTLPGLCLSDALQSSVAGSARVSYGRVGGKGDRALEDDVRLYTQLLSSGHWSAFEHQAGPMPMINGIYHDDYGIEQLLDFDMWRQLGATHMDFKGRLWSGNFRGWAQYRQLVNEWNEV
jgi:thymidylate synthase ThyX